MLSIQQTNLKKQLLPEYHKYLLLFHPNQVAKLYEYRMFNYKIELIGILRKEPMYKFDQTLLT